jgi:hypothetical protein
MDGRPVGTLWQEPLQEFRSERLPVVVRRAPYIAGAGALQLRSMNCSCVGICSTTPCITR